MKNVARSPPGLLIDIATLMAMAENFLDLLEQGVGPEDLRVWKRPLIMRNKKCEEKTYYRWYCSWHDGNKTFTEYLGSCGKVSEAEALEKAKRLKAGHYQDAKEMLKAMSVDRLDRGGHLKRQKEVEEQSHNPVI
jgi:hypothetical protein